MSEKKYDAFISYRHLPLDKAVAKRLQELLERIKPPRGLECKNTKKISRIFRDESELPTSGDLGNDIITALENSAYLIVLCSPKLKESKWCMAEIDHFKKLHGGRVNRILPVLLDGDPSEAFPDSLRYDARTIVDENGIERTELVEVEPLACNISANGDIPKTLKKLNTEFLRIAAPILGCGFDDLYRRHHRRKVRRIVTTVSVSAVLLMAFVLTYIFQSQNMIANRDAMYVSFAETAYVSGLMPDAVFYAMQALQPRNRLMPGYLPQAQFVLTNALGVYDMQDGFRPFKTLELSQRVLNIAISDDGKTAAAVCAFEVVIFDTMTAEVSATLNTINSALAEAVFLDNNILIFAGVDGLTAYDTAANQILWTAEQATGIAVSADQSTIAAIYRADSRAVIYNPDGTIRHIVDFDGKHQFVPYNDIFANPNNKFTH